MESLFHCWYDELRREWWKWRLPVYYLCSSLVRKKLKLLYALDKKSSKNSSIGSKYMTVKKKEGLPSDRLKPARYPKYDFQQWLQWQWTFSNLFYESFIQSFKKLCYVVHHVHEVLGHSPSLRLFWLCHLLFKLFMWQWHYLCDLHNISFSWGHHNGNVINFVVNTSYFLICCIYNNYKIHLVNTNENLVFSSVSI